MIDQPFTGTREYLVSFNPIEATDLDPTVHVVSSFPCPHTGMAEIHSTRDIKLLPQQTGV